MKRWGRRWVGGGGVGSGRAVGQRWVMRHHIHVIQIWIYEQSVIKFLSNQLPVNKGAAGLPANGGGRVCGKAFSLADAALFPTLVFILDIAPAVFGWSDPLARRPKLAAHWAEMSEGDAAGKRVVEEMRGGLAAWFDGDRWKELGIRDQVAADPGAFKH